MNAFDSVLRCRKALDGLDTIKYGGRVERIQGQMLYCYGPVAQIGEICRVFPSKYNPYTRQNGMNVAETPGDSPEIYGEIVALEKEHSYVLLYDPPFGLRVGDELIALGHELEVPVSEELLGRVVDPLVRPLDNGPPIAAEIKYPVQREAPAVMDRPPIEEQLCIGVRAIDGLLPLGKGQRVGIFSGSGVGKSTLLGMAARNTAAEVVVIALIGERSREVREFLERDLGEAGRARSILVVSTSNSPALSRIRGAYSATAIAEYFRDQGKDVLLLFDSVTRFATAGREVGLAVGEPPTVRGFPPSVFNSLPLLLERAGRSEKGSITGIYNVLVEGDDLDEPVSDTIRGILDGHIILSRGLAERYHYPAIDVPVSVSRLEQKVSVPEFRPVIAHVKRLLSVYRERQDLIEIGAYASGSNPLIDEAIERQSELQNFLQQDVYESSSLEDTLHMLLDMVGSSQSESHEPAKV
ncbi:MAG: FliI/YscN family ATPase [Spirochaetota bacterium]